MSVGIEALGGGFGGVVYACAVLLEAADEIPEGNLLVIIVCHDCMIVYVCLSSKNES